VLALNLGFLFGVCVTLAYSKLTLQISFGLHYYQQNTTLYLKHIVMKILRLENSMEIRNMMYKKL